MTKWKMKDGKEIEIAAMSDRHLRNTIRLLRRHYIIYCRDNSSNCLAYAYDILTPDGASMCAEQEGEYWLEEACLHDHFLDYCKQAKSLLRELKKRKLKELSF